MKKFLLAPLAFVVLVLPSFSFAAPDYTGQLDNAGEAVYGNANTISSDLPSMVGSIISALLSVIGIYFLYLIMRAGWLWMSAQGESKQVVEAKDTLVRAVVGLIILLAAYSITSYVIDSLGTLAT